MSTLSAAGVSRCRVLRELPAQARKQSIYGSKIVRCLLLSALTTCLATVVSGRSAAPDLRYRFPLGQTNVYHVDVQVRGESGLETTAGNVFLVALEAGSNVVRLSYHANLDVKRDADGSPYGPNGGFGGMFRGRTPVPSPDRCEVQFDDRGRLLRDAGDSPLPLPFGTLMTALVEPLPESSSATKWEASGDTTVIDAPYWLGPVSEFTPQPPGSPFYMNYGQRGTIAVLAVSRHAGYRVTATTPETVTIHKQLTLHSLLKNSGDPRASSTVEGDLVFDRAAGMFRQIDVQGNALGSTETASRNVRVALKCQWLQGADLAAALAPSAAASTAKPTAEELQKLMTDLASNDVGVRRSAANRLGNATLDSPSPELLNLMASLATDSENSIRASAASFLKTYGTTNEVPVLIKLLRDSDWNARQNAIKGLSRMKDERAIDPLVDELMRGGSPGQQEATAALVAIGAPAETAVLQMLQQKYLETRREACRILQRIGTSKSLEPLQEIVGDPDQSLSQAAADAIRAIKFRQ